MEKVVTTVRFGVAAASVALAATGFAFEPACEEARGWTPCAALSDEFDGGGLDRAKWDDFCPTFPGRRGVFAVLPENTSVTNGELVLKATMRDLTSVGPREAAYRFGPYATAMVKSRAKQAYGYYELRAKTMKACVSNAFWLYDPHAENPAVKYAPGDVSEEIDIFEVTGRPDVAGKFDCSRTYFNTLHLVGTPYLEGVVNRTARKIPNKTGATRLDFDLSDGYHVYGFLWTPEKLVWYLDGKVTFERENDLYHRPLHLDLDAEIFPTWFGLPDPKDLPASFHIDYVRVWTCPPPRNRALVPRMKIEPLDYDWFARHDRIVRCAQKMNPQVVLLGDDDFYEMAGPDSIGGGGVLNLGFAKDRTGNVLWRIDHGELDGIDPKLVILRIGANNLKGTENYPADSAADVAAAVEAIAAKIRAKLPKADLLLSRCVQ